MTSLQREIITVLANSGISENVLILVGSILKSDDYVPMFIDLMKEKESQGWEMTDHTVTSVMLEMMEILQHELSGFAIMEKES